MFNDLSSMARNNKSLLADLKPLLAKRIGGVGFKQTI